jgi:hypothetical protein
MSEEKQLVAFFMRAMHLFTHRRQTLCAPAAVSHSPKDFLPKSHSHCASKKEETLRDVVSSMVAEKFGASKYCQRLKY